MCPRLERRKRSGGRGRKSYATLVYEELWPGIDLVYSGMVNRMKYNFLIKSVKSEGSQV